VETQALENWNDVFASLSGKPLRIVSLAEDQKGYLWVGTWSMGCFKVDPKSRKVLEHFPSGSTIFNIICDSRGTVWFPDGWDLCAYRNGEGSLQRYRQSYNVFNLCEDTVRKRVWTIGNLGADIRLSWFDQMTGTFTQVPTNLTGRFASSIAIDSKMRIWLGSWGNGLYVSDQSVSSFQRINTSGFTGARRNTNHNSITNIYIDAHGILWLSTSYGGVLILYPNKGFRNMANNENNDWRDYNVTAIGGAASNRLLVGSIANGLYDVGSPLQPLFRRNNLVPTTRINQIYQHNGQYLLATREGFYVFPKGLQQAPTRYYPDEKITALLATADNQLWMGTQEHGLLRMPFLMLPDTSQATLFSENAPAPGKLENNRINKLVQDKQGNVWVATHSGINLWERKTGQFRSHSNLFAGKLPAVIVHDLLLTDKFLYMATPNGLFKAAFVQKANAPVVMELAEHYHENHGLVNQFICALQQDRNGHIWFSTTTGISRLNSHTGVLHHFGKQDGVQINAFHIAASYRDSTGAICFGGDNGLMYFNPELVVATYEQPTLIVTGLIINNRPVEVDQQQEDEQILTKAIQYTDKISLDYAHNHIAVKFAANDFLGTGNISFAYKLEPNDKDWIVLNEKNEVSFTGLKPGRYKLSIRANRNNQGWGNPTVLTLRIAYPPWLAWYAWIVYALAGLGIVVAIRKFRLHQQVLKTELQRVQFEKEKEHEINEAKINFFTNISHEFRTPLTLILSPCTELLSRGDIAPPDLQKISLIKSNAQKLLRLINQLLDFRRSEHGLLNIRTESTDLVKMVRGLLSDFAPAADAKNINLALEVEASEMMADVDKSQMEMAVSNLLSNAIKFTNANGKVTVRLDADGQVFKLQVSDSGIGIEPEHLDKIFQRFYQAPTSGRQQVGSGIGLAFAKNIVELHNGTISVSSKPGQGTVFTIIAPMHRVAATQPDVALIDEEHEDEVVEEAKTIAPATVQNNRQTILVVDDNEDIRQYLAGLLQDEFEVLQAKDGSEGHKAALEAIPDLIISDVMMPHMDGTDMCRELKNNMATSHIPIILLTARVSEAYELSGLQTGADDYITKPFNPLIVQMRVRNMLDNRRKLKAFYLKKVRFQPDTDLERAENLDEVFLNKAIELVNANLQNKNLGIEMMVDHLFMSQSTLFRKIKSLTGLSITGFIRALRTKKAAQFILQSNMKMSDIAYEVGFNDYKYFKKSFQQQFGCLPSEYREKYAEDLKS
jgi:signal transduction histidine kinase/DNA-binding response OmpR family regulator/ligand-binding sensor domain-containing protein